jgi:hypothetical protein
MNTTSGRNLWLSKLQLVKPACVVQSGRCAASAACTRNPLPRRDPIRKGVSWVDLASAGQLDPPPNITGTKRDKKLGFKKRIRI